MYSRQRLAATTEIKQLYSRIYRQGENQVKPAEVSVKLTNPASHHPEKSILLHRLCNKEIHSWTPESTLELPISNTTPARQADWLNENRRYRYVSTACSCYG